MFFPSNSDALAIAEAQAVCRRCPVSVECLDAADAHREKHGIWGGRPRNCHGEVLKKPGRPRKSDEPRTNVSAAKMAAYRAKYAKSFARMKNRKPRVRR